MHTGRLIVAMAFVAPTCLISQSASSAETSPRIEEIVVTAEMRESTVSDSAISITAFDESLIEEFGIQGADELVNYLPATTRDDYDIRIRGVGRNFRALGGDPGVATYYNGVYSEDFLIAASESALYDIARIEVLRGPQGTLYGRNAIGGALNYITNKPSYENELEIRGLFGNLGANEYFGVISGPIIADKLAYRIVGVSRDRDGAQHGIDGSEDVNSVGDQNVALALNWRVNDNMEFNVRWNDRSGNQKLGAGVLVTEGPITSTGEQLRGKRSTDIYALGLTDVPAPVGPLFGGFIPASEYTGATHTFTDPESGESRTGIYARPGVDGAAVSNINPAYQTNPDVFDSDLKNLHGYALTNNRNNENFQQNAVQSDFAWQLSETTALKWIGGWMEFDYTFWSDIDTSTSNFTKYHANVKANVETYSNELQLLWQIGDSLQMTSGVYQFNSNRHQKYTENDDANQGRYTRAVDYGLVGGTGTAPVMPGDADYGFSIFGDAGGTDEGLLYGVDNKVRTKAYAAFTQGTYTFDEQWAFTLGVRWARDEKSAQEQRGGYVELGQSTEAYNGFCLGSYGVTCEEAGLTGLAVMNMLMGAASFVPTFNPNMPITPTCQGAPADADPLTYQDCATPLRLQGYPISWADAGLPSDHSWDKFTWRANLEWTPDDSTMIYFGATTGYRSGGYSLGLLDTQTECRADFCFDPATGIPLPGRNGPSASYGPENVLAFELGYKAFLHDDRLQLSSAVYLYDYKGYQDEINEYDPETGGRRNVVVNADQARNYGWEIEATWLPTDHWTIGGNYSLTKTEYRSNLLVVEDNNPRRPESLFLDTDIDGKVINNTVVNLKGNQLKGIPEHKATIYSWYDLGFLKGTLTLGGSFSYTGSYYSNPINRSLDEVPERYQMDVSATWRDNQDHWAVRTFIDNVTNEGTTRGVGLGGGGDNWAQTGTYLYPRFYGVDLTYRITNW